MLKSGFKYYVKISYDNINRIINKQLDITFEEINNHIHKDDKEINLSKDVVITVKELKD